MILLQMQIFVDPWKKKTQIFDMHILSTTLVFLGGDTRTLKNANVNTTEGLSTRFYELASVSP